MSLSEILEVFAKLSLNEMGLAHQIDKLSKELEEVRTQKQAAYESYLKSMSSVSFENGE